MATIVVEIAEDRWPDLFRQDGSSSVWNIGQIVSLEADEDELLGEIFDRAATLLGIDLTDEVRRAHNSNEVRFSQVSRSFALRGSSGARLPYINELVVFNSGGGAEKHLRVWNVSYGQLKEAVDLGLVEGDPEWLYLVGLPEGSAPGVEWFEWLSVANAILTAYTLPGGIHATNLAIKKVVNKFRRGVAVAEREAQQLGERRMLPEDMRTLLNGRHWTAPQVARLLNVPEGEAVDWLEMFGFSQTEGGSWVQGNDSISRMLLGDIELANLGSLAFLGRDPLPEDENETNEIIARRIESIVAERVNHFIESGAAPPPLTYSDLFSWLDRNSSG